jgi:hypothetical protein
LSTDVVSFNNIFDILNDNIVDIEDLSDRYIKRARINLKNGYQVSIIRGYGTYSDENTFEVAIFDKDENILSGDVLGYVTEEKIYEIIKNTCKLS